MRKQGPSDAEFREQYLSHCMLSSWDHPDPNIIVETPMDCAPYCQKATPSLSLPNPCLVFLSAHLRPHSPIFHCPVSRLQSHLG
jgi:hypothetical protein